MVVLRVTKVTDRLTRWLATSNVGPAVEAIGLDPKTAVAWLAARPDGVPR